MSPKEIPEKPDPELSKEDLELSTAKFLKVTAAVADFYTFRDAYLKHQKQTTIQNTVSFLLEGTIIILLIKLILIGN